MYCGLGLSPEHKFAGAKKRRGISGRQSDAVSRVPCACLGWGAPRRRDGDHAYNGVALLFGLCRVAGQPLFAPLPPMPPFPFSKWFPTRPTMYIA